MEKKFCDYCNKEIDTTSGYFKLIREITERDYGFTTSFKVADLCSQHCLIEFAKLKRCSDGNNKI